MEITISPELEEIIKSKIASGLYNNSDEFIREAILSASERDLVKYVKLNKEVSRGMEEANAGEFSKRTVQDIIEANEQNLIRDE